MESCVSNKVTWGIICFTNTQFFNCFFHRKKKKKKSLTPFCFLFPCSQSQNRFIFPFPCFQNRSIFFFFPVFSFWWLLRSSSSQVRHFQRTRKRIGTNWYGKEPRTGTHELVRGSYGGEMNYMTMTLPMTLPSSFMLLVHLWTFSTREGYLTSSVFEVSLWDVELSSRSKKKHSGTWTTATYDI